MSLLLPNLEKNEHPTKSRAGMLLPVPGHIIINFVAGSDLLEHLIACMHARVDEGMGEFELHQSEELCGHSSKLTCKCTEKLSAWPCPGPGSAIQAHKCAYEINVCRHFLRACDGQAAERGKACSSWVYVLTGAFQPVQCK